MLVIKRIKQLFHLTADEEDRETIERVLKVYAEGCPVARSVKGSIEITSELDITGALQAPSTLTQGVVLLEDQAQEFFPEVRGGADVAGLYLDLIQIL